MDPFTQRMLERAKIRREKLDSHKMELEQTTVLQENSNVSHKRKPLEVYSGKNTFMDNSSDKECISKARKSKLQKLAQFYSGESENILYEDIENKDDVCEIDEPKQQLKLERLTQLASKIREWDDDDAVRKNMNVEKPAKTKESEATKKISEKTSWDANLVKNLCSQGFTLKENESKLVYNFPKPQTGDEVTKSKTKNFTASEGISKNGGCGDSKENENKVLRKAAFFEGCAKEETNVRIKDPTELSVAERKALFEKNLSEAIFPNNNFFKNVSQKSNFDHHKVPVDVKSKIREVNTFSTEKTQFEQPKPENNCSTKFKGREEYKQNKIIAPDSPGVVPAPPPMPGIQDCVEDELTSEEKNSSENNLDNTGGAGRLYPSLSNLDITEVNDSTLSELESANESKNSNFYLNMTLSDLMEINKNNPSTPPSENSFSKSKECQVLNKMNKLLENALNELSSEEDEDTESEKVFKSPPNMIKSSSFEYKSNNEERNENNLLHTVSFYRKQQSSVHSPNHGAQEMEEGEESCVEQEINESVLVQEKIEELLVEVSKQQTIISQASQALNLCLSTVEFSGSEEQVEGERLLLLATHKRQACLNEIQRLKVENSLRSQEGKLLTEKGDVNLSNISVKLKRDAIRALVAAENHLYFVCLIKSDEQVLATPVVSVLRENLKDLTLQFPGQVKLESLLSNFKITVEVYSLELNKECLPHNVKYHIANKKEKKLLTPIKSKKSESKLVKPYIQSPAGPNAVRTSNFQMCGYIVFSLKEITRTQWTLNKVPYISPLEGTLSMSIKSQLRLEDEFRGFLTMFDDISGFGAWHRRWCLLSSHFISYWKYPDDEQKKVPIGTIDLKSVITENVGVVSRDVCARLNTFLLESTRTRLNDDKNSLVLNVNGNTTTIRHLLSADSKQEMLTWCRKLNTTLALLRSWKCNNKE